jgi:hypothetical protein
MFAKQTDREFKIPKLERVRNARQSRNSFRNRRPASIMSHFPISLQPRVLGYFFHIAVNRLLFYIRGLIQVTQNAEPPLLYNVAICIRRKQTFMGANCVRTFSSSRTLIGCTKHNVGGWVAFCLLSLFFHFLLCFSPSPEAAPAIAPFLMEGILALIAGHE